MKIENEYVQTVSEIKKVEGKIDKCPEDGKPNYEKED